MTLDLPAGGVAGHTHDYASVEHSMLKVDVADEHGQIIGRPWLTAVTHEDSRLILGFHISHQDPSWASVLMALQNAAAPKSKYLLDLGYPFARDWNTEGLPKVLAVDRAAEFRSPELSAFARSREIKLVEMPHARDHLAGRFEDWYLTDGQAVLGTIPGYADLNEQRNPDTARPTLNLRQLETAMAAWIVDVYHNALHPTTRERPAYRYGTGIESGM